jgi:hypothetical protein
MRFSDNSSTVEATPGLVQPLTPFENYFAIRAGRAGYEGSFIEHLVPVCWRP